MFNAMFAGSTAQATNESLQQWKMLWMQQEKQEKDAKAEADRQDLLARQQKWTEENAAATRKFQTQRDQQQWQQDVWKTDFEAASKYTDPTAQSQALAHARESGSPFAGTLQAAYSQSLLNPEAAWNYLNQIWNPTDEGFIANEDFAKRAASIVGTTLLGYTDKELQDFVNSAVKDVAKRNELGLEFRSDRVEERKTQLLQGQENLTSTKLGNEESIARTEQIRESTEQMRKQGAREEDLHAGNMEQQALLTQRLVAEVKSAEVDADFAPALAAANLEALLTRTDGERVANETQKAMQESLVQQAANAAREGAATAEEAEHRAAIAAVKAANAFELGVIELDTAGLTRDQARKQLDVMQAQLDESAQRITNAIQDLEYRGLLTDQVRQQLEAEKVNMVTSLASQGQVELAEYYARNNLTDLIGEENMEWFVDELKDEATRNRTAEQWETAAKTAANIATTETAGDLAQANLEAAQANASLAGKKDRDYDEDRARDWWATQQGIALSERSLALQAAKATAGGGGGGGSDAPPDTNAVLAEINRTLGINVDKVQNYAQDFRQTQALNAEAREHIYNVQNGTPQQVAESLAWLRREFPQVDLTDPRTISTSLDTLETSIAREEDAASARASAAVGAMFNAAARMGYALDPSDLGFQPDDPLWSNGVRTNPAVQEATKEYVGRVTAEGKAQEGDIRSSIEQYALAMSEESIAVGGLSQIYSKLKDKYGEDVLASIGIRQPRDLLDVTTAFRQQFQQQQKVAENVMKARGLDITSTTDRELVTRELLQTNSDLTDLYRRVVDAGPNGMTPELQRELLEMETKIRGPGVTTSPAVDGSLISTDMAKSVIMELQREPQQQLSAFNYINPRIEQQSFIASLMGAK